MLEKARNAKDPEIGKESLGARPRCGATEATGKQSQDQDQAKKDWGWEWGWECE